MTSSSLLGCTAPIWVSLLGYHIMLYDLLLAIILTAGCFALELRRRAFRWMPLYGLALALQPGWSYLADAIRGGLLNARADCFYGPRATSIHLLAITLALLIVVWRRSSITRSSFLFAVAVAMTVMCLLEICYIVGGWAIIPRFLKERMAFDEFHDSLFTGFGSLGQLLVFVLICIVLYIIQRRSRATTV